MECKKVWAIKVTRRFNEDPAKVEMLIAFDSREDAKTYLEELIERYDYDPLHTDRESYDTGEEIVVHIENHSLKCRTNIIMDEAHLLFGLQEKES